MPGVIFDLDGTLVDSAPAIRDVANALMAELGLPPLDLDEARAYVGHGAARFLARALHARGETTDEPGFGSKLARFNYHYGHAPGEANIPFPNVEQALRSLVRDGYCLGICTNKPAAPTGAALAALGWTALFKTVVTGDTLEKRKPDPEPLHHAARSLCTMPVVYVGDSEVDAETAMRADIPFLLFMKGYRTAAAESLMHRAAFSDFDELPGLIKAQF